MTINVFLVVYFVLKNDLSMSIFEALIELLDQCKTVIGNQLHGRTTARTIALGIDELFLNILVEFILSDELEEFSQIGDELTDVGGLKVLFSKLRFFESGWDLQELVFSIFESSGSSEKMLDDFTEDFVRTFTRHSNLSKEEILNVLAKKLVCGGSNRASKLLKFG